MQQDIVISIPKTDSELVAAIKCDPTLSTTMIGGAAMDGGSELLIYLIPLAHLTGKALVDLLKSHWKKAEHVKIEIGGIKISGASLDEVSKFLEKSLPKPDGK